MNNYQYNIKKCYQWLVSILLLVITSTSLYADQSQAKKLEELSNRFEELRQELNIPGMALAIVKDDQIIFAKGYGYRDLEEKIAVTPDTNFAIGSTSKAFTSTLVGMLNDEDKMTWDAKVTDYLDWFEPDLNDETGNLTIRDMLSNRSGLSRNDILWASGKVGREDILKESLDAVPLDKFREKFNYNNVLFLASGMASAKAAEAENWDALLQEKILSPLKMTSSTSIHNNATNLSLGYRWNESLQAHDYVERKNLDNISPAGGIHSNVLDMAQWLRFNLNKGEVDGKRLLSEQQFDELWEPAVSVSGNISYGLGWFLREWKGKKVIEHGGNILGYAAQVALMPEERLGFVLLTNITMTRLQQGSMEVVWRALVNEVEQEIQSAEEKDFAQYIGRYVANFGPFRDTFFTVQVNDDGDLAVDVPGQTLYALNQPDKDGKWYFQMTDTIAVSFEEINNDRANLLKMHQNGMNFELPREGYVIKPEVELTEFTHLLGDYAHNNLPRPIKALISNNRLAIDVPGEMVYELQLPDDDDHRAFRINASLSAKFSIDDDGNGESVTIYRNKRKALRAKRVEDASVEELPSVAEILKLMDSEKKIAAFKKWGPSTAIAKISMLQAGVTGTMQMSYQGDDKYIQHLDFGDYGKISTVLNGNYAATVGFEPYIELTGALLEQAKAEHPIANLDLASFYDSIKVIEKREVDGRNVYLVELKKQDLPLATIAVDAETGDVIKRRGGLMIKDIGTIPITITYSDFRLVNGVRMPNTMNFFNPMNGNLLFEYQSFEINQTFDENMFSLKHQK